MCPGNSPLLGFRVLDYICIKQDRRSLVAYEKGNRAAYIRCERVNCCEGCLNGLVVGVEGRIRRVLGGQEAQTGDDDIQRSDSGTPIEIPHRCDPQVRVTVAAILVKTCTGCSDRFWNISCWDGEPARWDIVSPG